MSDNPDSEPFGKCSTCGAIIELDVNNRQNMITHGWLNLDTGQFECDGKGGSEPIPQESIPDMVNQMS